MAEDLVNGWKVQRGVTLLDNERDGIRATVERRIKLDDTQGD